MTTKPIKTRRTLALSQSASECLERIKERKRLPTDIGAIEEAIHFYGQFSDRTPAEIAISLQLKDIIRDQISAGNSLYVGPNRNDAAQLLIILPEIPSIK